MATLRPSTKPALNLWAQVAPAATVVVSLYLWAWAWRWPHSDARNTGAIMVGFIVLAIGVGTGIVARRRHGAAAIAWLVPSLLAIGLGLLCLSGVTDGQREACGDYPAACGSLLPGL